MLLISGTGSIVLARTESGDQYEASGLSAPESSFSSASCIASDFRSFAHKRMPLLNGKFINLHMFPLMKFFIHKYGWNHGQYFAKCQALSNTEKASQAKDILQHYAARADASIVN